MLRCSVVHLMSVTATLLLNPRTQILSLLLCFLGHGKMSCLGPVLVSNKSSNDIWDCLNATLSWVSPMRIVEFLTILSIISCHFPPRISCFPLIPLISLTQLWPEWSPLTILPTKEHYWPCSSLIVGTLCGTVWDCTRTNFLQTSCQAARARSSIAPHFLPNRP